MVNTKCLTRTVDINVTENVIFNGRSGGFSLPLSNKEFTRAIRLGLGRAGMQAKGETSLHQLSIILDECLHCRVEGELEGLLISSRAPWLVEMATAMRALEPLGKAISSSLSSPSPKFENRFQFQDSEQQLEIAYEFATKGHRAFRDLLYQNLQSNEFSSQLTAESQIVRLDEEDGLLHVARFHGRLAHKDPNHRASSMTLYEYDEEFGEGESLEILEQCAKMDAHVNAYLESIELQKEDESQTCNDKQLNSVAEVLRFIHKMEESSDSSPCWSWGRKSTEAERRQLQKHIFEFEESYRLFAVLRAFLTRGSGLPDFDQRLLDLIHHGELRIRQSAAAIIEKFENEQMRLFALECLRDDRFRYGVQFLALNHRPGDVDSILPQMELPEDAFDRECLLNALLSFSKHSREGLPTLPIWVYENTSNLNMRRHALELLLETGTAPNWLIEECHFDVYDVIREWVDPQASSDDEYDK